MEKVSKRVNAIQEVKESVGLLSQLLGDYNKESSSQSNEELIKVSNTCQQNNLSHPLKDSGGFRTTMSLSQDLYQRCEKMRPTLFRLASDTEDNDEALGEAYSSKGQINNFTNSANELMTRVHFRHCLCLCLCLQLRSCRRMTA